MLTSNNRKTRENDIADFMWIKRCNSDKVILLQKVNT